MELNIVIFNPRPGLFLPYSYKENYMNSRKNVLIFFIFYIEIVLRIVNILLFSKEKNFNLISIGCENVSFSVVNIFYRVKENMNIWVLRDTETVNIYFSAYYRTPWQALANAKCLPFPMLTGRIPLRSRI